MPEICIIKFGIMSVLIEQALMIAFFDNRAFFHDNDSIGGFDGR